MVINQHSHFCLVFSVDLLYLCKPLENINISGVVLMKVLLIFENIDINGVVFMKLISIFKVLVKMHFR